MIISKKDQRILDALSANARAPVSQIAKEVGLSRQAVARHTAKLEEEGIIAGYETVIDYEALGLSHYEVLLTFTELTLKQQYIDYFVNHPYSRWVGETLGEPHLRVNFLAKDNEHFEDILRGIDQDLGKEIRELRFNTILEHIKHRRVSGGKEEKRKPPELDATDVELLRKLCLDPKISLVELAEALNYSIEGVRQKKKKLEQSVIIRYTINYNNAAVDKRVWSVLYVQLRNRTPQLDSKTTEFVLQHKDIGNSHKYLGEWNLHLTIYGDSIYAVNDTIHEFTNTFNKDIKKIQFLIMLRNHKYPKIGIGTFDILAERVQTSE